MSKVFANGPIRLVFELYYAPWEFKGVKVSEVKRITLDAGSNMNRIESTFKVEGNLNELPVGIGIGNHKTGKMESDTATGILKVWLAFKTGNGAVGKAVVIDPALISEMKTTDLDYLLITKAQPGSPLVYYAGFGWDKSGDFVNQAAFGNYVTQFSKRIASPIKISVGK